MAVTRDVDSRSYGTLTWFTTPNCGALDFPNRKHDTVRSMSTPLLPARRGRGRPRKFAAPSRAVTLTLPDDTLARLAAMHHDISHAIVRLCDMQRPASTSRPAAELTMYGRRAVITIRPTPSLERRVGIDLVPLPNGRALISFDQPKTIPDLELTLNDVLEDRTLTNEERQVFESIRTILKEARRSNDVLLLRRNIIVLEYISRAKGDAATGSKSRPVDRRASRRRSARGA